MPAEDFRLFTAVLSLEQIPGALRLVSAFEAEGWLSAEEADEWRIRLSASYGCQSLARGTLAGVRGSRSAAKCSRREKTLPWRSDAA